MSIELQPRLVLRYTDGQFTFSRFAMNATPSQLMDLATSINAFQTTPLAAVRRIRSIQF